MQAAQRERIIALVRREVVPAIGCTEPVAVSLCVAKATELLGREPRRIEVRLSANVLKNAMGVGIPGTGMTGLPIAVALGALAGKPEYGLEVLRDVTPQDVERGRRMIEEKAVRILLKKDAPDTLYIEARCSAGADAASAVIAGCHTAFTFLERNGQVLLDTKNPAADCHSAPAEEDPALDMRMVYDFAMEAPLEEIEFILKAGRMNLAAAELSLEGHYGHSLGRMLRGCGCMMGGGLYSEIIAHTSAACDARMAGAKIPVMSNSGSGNQGISSCVPVMVYARLHGSTHEELVRALMLSSLTVIYIKQGLGRLSALCGCVVAATGSSCALTYLMGGRSYERICYAVKNMIANLTGMICDGAKPSCALKVSSGTSTAVFSALMALEGKCVTPVEGIIDEDVDQCVRNLTRIGAQGMTQTDSLVLDIMVQKS